MLSGNELPNKPNGGTEMRAVATALHPIGQRSGDALTMNEGVRISKPIMICSHVLNRGSMGVSGPCDLVLRYERSSKGSYKTPLTAV
jgi:hypothetical protein